MAGVAALTAPSGKDSMIARNAGERKKRMVWDYGPIGGRTSPLVRAFMRIRSSSSIVF